MSSRLDSAFGGLGVGAPGRYLFGGSFFRLLGCLLFVIENILYMFFAFWKMQCFVFLVSERSGYIFFRWIL